MKIYTKTGDRGKTSLFSGERVSKAHQRLEAYGEIDELNSVLGALGTALAGDNQALLDEIQRVQSELMRISAWLATTPGTSSSNSLPGLNEALPAWLETSIDRMDKDLPLLKGFILPGGHPSAAWAHVARTVCRRAERHVVALIESTGTGGTPEQCTVFVTYLNRLSDYLFVLARHLNRIHGVSDIPWTP